MKERLKELAQEAAEMTNKNAWAFLNGQIHAEVVAGNISPDNRRWAQDFTWYVRREIRAEKRANTKNGV